MTGPTNFCDVSQETPPISSTGRATQLFEDMSTHDPTAIADSGGTTLVNTPECITDAEEPPSKAEEMASKAVKKVKNAALYTFGDAPLYQQDNHYILSGYRGELKSFQGCFESLWYLHNETGMLSFGYKETDRSEYMVPFSGSNWVWHSCGRCII